MLSFFLHSNASASYLGTIPSENEEINFLSAGGKSTEVYWQWGCL
jgi:hypothetical protein